VFEAQKKELMTVLSALEKKHETTVQSLQRVSSDLEASQALCDTKEAKIQALTTKLRTLKYAGRFYCD